MERQGMEQMLMSQLDPKAVTREMELKTLMQTQKMKMKMKDERQDPPDKRKGLKGTLRFTPPGVEWHFWTPDGDPEYPGYPPKA